MWKPVRRIPALGQDKPKKISVKALSEADITRLKALARLGELVFKDVLHSEKLLGGENNLYSVQKLSEELSRWDDEQKEKWDLFNKHQEDEEDTEVENLAYLELERIYKLVRALNEEDKK